MKCDISVLVPINDFECEFMRLKGAIDVNLWRRLKDFEKRAFVLYEDIELGSLSFNFNISNNRTILNPNPKFFTLKSEFNSDLERNNLNAILHVLRFFVLEKENLYLPRTVNNFQGVFVEHRSKKPLKIFKDYFTSNRFRREFATFFGDHYKDLETFWYDWVHVRGGYHFNNNKQSINSRMRLDSFENHLKKMNNADFFELVVHFTTFNKILSIVSLGSFISKISKSQGLPISIGNLENFINKCLK